MTTSGGLVSRIQNKGVKLWLHTGKLHYRDSLGVLSPEDIDWLKNRRRDIVSELTKRAASSVDSQPYTGGLRSGPAPMTFQQECALSFAGEMLFGAFAVRIAGSLRIDQLIRSLNTIVRRHESLRTKIIIVDAMPTQQIGVSSECPLEIVDFDGSPNSNVDSEVLGYIERSFKQWRNDGATTFEARLLKLATDDHVLVILWDHLFSDWYSQGLVFQELWKLYRDFPERERLLLSNPPVQYADYARWQRAAYANWASSHGQYWEHRLSGSPRLQLPSDSGLGVPHRTAGLEFSLGAALSSALQSIAERSRVSLSFVAFSLASVVLSRWCYQRDFVLPVTFSGRYYPEHLDLVGYLPNVLLLRIGIAESDTFVDLFKLVSREYFSAIEHLDVGKTVDGGVPELLEGPAAQWFPSHPFMTMAPPATQWDARAQQIRINQIKVKYLPFEGAMPSFTFMFVLGQTTDGIVGKVWYRADLYPESTVRKLSEDLVAMAKYAVSEPHTRIAAIPA